MELLDIYDDQGNRTGRTIVRGDKNAKLNEHEHIALSIIFIENNNHEFLIQKASKEKGAYYSSTGGHVNHNETPQETIVREIEEELGIKVDPNEIQELGFIHYDMPLRYLFYLNKDIKIDDCKLQVEEVDFIDYKTKEEIEELIEKKEFLESHGILFHELEKRINI